MFLGNTKQLGAVDFGNFRLGQNLNDFDIFKNWVVVSNNFIFTTIWGKDPQFDQYFSQGLKPPSSSGTFSSVSYPFLRYNCLMSECGVTFNDAINFYEEVRHPRRSS